MTLASVLHAIFGNAAASGHAKAHQEWRSAVHESRNEASKAMAVAQLSIRSSEAAYSAMAETIRKQEQSVDRQFLDHARGKS